MESKERYGAFLLYVDDWLSSTAIELMTPAQEAGYLRLLMYSWKSEDCGIPDDDAILARLTRLGKTFRGNTRGVLRAQFTPRDGRLYNERLLRERSHQQEVRRSRSEAAKTAAERRWNASRIPDAEQKDANPNSNPNSIDIERETLSPEWNAFRSLYPEHRFDESKALKQWQQHEDHAAIIEGLKAHVQSEEWRRDGKRFVPKASKFIGDGLYSVPPLVAPAPATSRYREWDGKPDESTMDPETARRIREGRKTIPAPYLDPASITGKPSAGPKPWKADW